MDEATRNKVRDLNYDHHRRMTDLAEQRLKDGTSGDVHDMDEQSYRTLLASVPRDRMRILELGSSSGGQFPLLQEWLGPFGTILGIDLYEPNVTRAQAQGLSIVHGYVEDMQMFGDESFDLVCSRHVMEHLGDLEAGIQEITRITKQYGYVAHVTPDLEFDNEPAHLNHLDLQEWAMVWVRAGFRLIYAKKHGYHGGEVHIVGRRY